MGRQKKNMQSKGMEDFPLKELNEMEVSKQSDIEFKRMVIRMLRELTDNYKKLSENYNSMKRGRRNHKKAAVRSKKYNI